MTYYGIANPSMLAENSNFCRHTDPDAEDLYKCPDDETPANQFNYNLIFENCTKYGAETIGVV